MQNKKRSPTSVGERRRAITRRPVS
ncbi:MAG: hypothetical protein RLY87_1958, partial [Chloroflexota bacterium]